MSESIRAALKSGSPGQTIALLLASAFFLAAGIGHFTHADFFVAIMPPYLPAHLELVHLSGVFEILGGVGLLLPPVRRAAGIGLIALLIAVFPANLHMAMNPELFPDMAPLALYIRLPFQLVFAIWVLRVSQPQEV